MARRFEYAQAEEIRSEAKNLPRHLRSPRAYEQRSVAYELVERLNFRSEKNGGASVDEQGLVTDADGTPVGVEVDGVVRKGFGTPSKKLEMFSPTLFDWGCAD